MREVGYSPVTAHTPSNLTDSKAFQAWLNESGMTDELLQEVHLGLLKSTRIEHLVFPLGPKTEKEEKVLDRLPANLETILDAELELQRTTLTDEAIIKMLAEVNCTVRTIVHGNTARHVYYWAADTKAREKALDMAYELKDRYPKRGPSGPATAIQINVNKDRDEFRR